MFIIGDYTIAEYIIGETQTNYEGVFVESEFRIPKIKYVIKPEVQDIGY